MATTSIAPQSRSAGADRPGVGLNERGELGVTLAVPAGRTVLIEGDPIEHYYRIVSGAVRLYKAVADGRRQIIDFLGPEDCFGLTGLDVFDYSVEAISNLVLIRYPRQRIEAAIDQEPDVGRELYRLACVELQQAQRRLLLLGRKSAEERIASFLLDLAARQHDEPVAGRVIHLAMTRQDIADHLGLTIETVSRILGRLRRAGLIGLPDRHDVVLKVVERLTAIAEGEVAV